MIDPGLGFAKTTAHNVAILKSLESLVERAPVLIGASRKRFVGELRGDGEKMKGFTQRHRETEEHREDENLKSQISNLKSSVNLCPSVPLCEKAVSNRLGGSIAAALWSVLHGAAIVRVHDVRETVEALRVVEAMTSCHCPTHGILLR